MIIGREFLTLGRLISYAMKLSSGQKKELGRKQTAEKEEMGTSAVGETMNGVIPAGVDPIPLKK